MCCTVGKHVVVDCMIHKAPDGFAGLRRQLGLGWKNYTLIFEGLANDYISIHYQRNILCIRKYSLIFKTEATASVSGCFTGIKAIGRLLHVTDTKLC